MAVHPQSRNMVLAPVGLISRMPPSGDFDEIFVGLGLHAAIEVSAWPYARYSSEAFLTIRAAAYFMPSRGFLECG